MFNRGEVWFANLNLGQGTEPGKTSPVLIVQCQDLLDADHPSTIIIPLTTNLVNNAEPLRLRIPAGQKLKKDSDLLVDQVRAIDNNRLVSGPVFECSASIMNQIDRCLMEVLGFV